MNEPRAQSTDPAASPRQTGTPTLNLKFLSHGTLETRDLDFARRFYEEFMGFEVVRSSRISLWIRLGGLHTYVVVQAPPGKQLEMNFMNHNGVDVETEEQVEECHRLVTRDADKWQLKKITKPRIAHGTYSFYFFDADNNAWEILANPPGGYDWMFKRGDQEGLGHQSKKFDRPISTRRTPPDEEPKS